MLQQQVPTKKAVVPTIKTMIMTTSIPGMSPTRNGGDGRGAGGGTGQLASQSTQLQVVELA